MCPLKDRDRTRPRRLVRLGIIRLGEKRTNSAGKEYPAELDYFRLDDAPEIAEFYGDKPRELDVLMPFSDVARNFDASYNVWAGGVLVCRGDGEYVEYATPHEVKTKTWKDKRGNQHTSKTVSSAPGDTLVSNGVAQVAFGWNGEEFQPGDHVPCPGEQADLYPHCRACKASAILKVMMAHPDLFRFGYYQIATGSGRNYDTILGVLEEIYSQTHDLRGIPFKLRKVQEQTTYKDNGQRKTTKKWFLQLESDPGYTRQLYRMRATSILNAGAPVARLAAGDDMDDDLPFDDFDEVDPEAPPPVAEETIDFETGEIISDDDNDDDLSWMTLDDVAPMTLKVGPEKVETPFTELNGEQLTYILDWPSKYSAVQRRAAELCIDALQAIDADDEPNAPEANDDLAAIEESADDTGAINVAEAQATFEGMIRNGH